MAGSGAFYSRSGSDFEISFTTLLRALSAKISVLIAWKSNVELIAKLIDVSKLKAHGLIVPSLVKHTISVWRSPRPLLNEAPVV